MLVDAIAGAPGDFADHDPQARVVDLLRSSASGAEDVMMVGPAADHVRVVPRREVKPLDRAELLEDIEGPEDGCASDSHMLGARFADQVARREVPVVCGDQRGEASAGLGQPVAGSVEGGDDRCRVHAWQPYHK
jgi:hypothetical protein